MANGTRKMARGERLRWFNRLTVQEFNDEKTKAVMARGM